MWSSRLIKFFGVLAGLQLIFAVFIFIVNNEPAFRATIGMAILGLYILWIIICGMLMKKYRDRIRDFIQKININWKVKFVLFATILALFEEIITTLMTNTAPLYGVTPEIVHITASTNYLDVVLSHSVILFFPMFIIWAFILGRYYISPNAVFILWGLSGWFMEALFRGFGHSLEIGMWVFVYGLMIYLPAYSIPQDRVAGKPGFWMYPLFVLIPLLGVIPGGLIATVIKIFRPPNFFPGF